MDRENPISPPQRFKSGVLAALEICADKRAQLSGPDTGANGSGGRRCGIARTAAIVEAEASRLEASDLGALEALCAGQMLALDAIFDQFAREAAQWDTLSAPSMNMALRAQSQCRATLKTLVSLKAKKKSRASDDRTIGSADFSA